MNIFQVWQIAMFQGQAQSWSSKELRSSGLKLQLTHVLVIPHLPFLDPSPSIFALFCATGVCSLWTRQKPFVSFSTVMFEQWFPITEQSGRRMQFGPYSPAPFPLRQPGVSTGVSLPRAQILHSHPLAVLSSPFTPAERNSFLLLLALDLLTFPVGFQ